ncbi:hypothetical protein JCM9279_002193 [Rhodotorula babjevae]
MSAHRLAPGVDTRLVTRADDGFWVPTFGDIQVADNESTATALAAVPVFNPKAGSPAPAPAPIFTVTSVVKIVRPITVTEVVVVEPATPAVVVTSTSTLEVPSAVDTVTLVATAPYVVPTTTTTEKLFGGASSSAYVRVVSLASSWSPAAPSAPTVDAPSSAAPQPSTSAYTPILVVSSRTSSTSERIFAPPTQSQVRAVVTTSAQASSVPVLATSSSTSSTSTGIPASTAAASASSSSSAPNEPGESSSAATASSIDVPSSDTGGSSAIAPSTQPSDAQGSGPVRTDLVSPTSAGSSSPGHPTRSSSVLGLPDATGSSSIFSHLGDSPANIALTTLVCFAILALLAALPIFCLCRRSRRRRRQDRIGHELGSGTGSPSIEEGWPVRSPSSARWTPPPPPHSGEPWSPSGELGEQVRLMRELWRETALVDVEVAVESSASEEATAGPGTTAAAGDARSPTTETSEWTSWVGGHASTDGLGSVGYFDPSDRRVSDATVTPEVLERRRRVAQPYALGSARQVRAPHPLRTALRPEDFSPSAYSPSSRHPSQRSPAYPSSKLGSPFTLRRDGLDEFPSTPTRPLWRESLDRVMGAAADLISATHLSRASADGDSRRGSLTRPFVGGLRRALAARKADEEHGDKTLLDEKASGDDDADRRSYDWFASYLGPRAPLVGSSVASSVADIERPVSPPSPLLGYIPAAGAMATLVPPRPAHVRAPSSRSIYDARPQLPRASSARPPAFLAVAEDEVDPFDSTHSRAITPPPFAPSPVPPPRTPTPSSALALAPIRASPAPFSQLEPAGVDAAAALDPFADPPSSPPSSPATTSPSPSSPSATSTASRPPAAQLPAGAAAAHGPLFPLAHHAAYAQLHLLRRSEARARRASTSGASPLVGLRTRSVRDGGEGARARPASVAVCGSGAPVREAQQEEQEEEEHEHEDDDVSSLALSSSSSSSASAAGAERQRLALERERAAVLMRERRRRSLCGSGAGGSSWRGSLVGHEDSEGGCIV